MIKAHIQSHFRQVNSLYKLALNLQYACRGPELIIAFLPLCYNVVRSQSIARLLS